MLDFNFNSLENTNFAGNSTQYLRPYGIYKVNLTKIENTTITSKDKSSEYPVVSLEFTGCEENPGVFSTNIFIPTKQEDMERPVFKNKEGHEYNRPSRFENFQYTLMQIVHALNPDGEEKIKNNASKIKSIDQFLDLVMRALKGKEKVNTYIKLVGRNNEGKVYSSLPDPCGLNKENKIFPVNFIGEKDSLFFTNFEITQQKAYNNAKPTTMSDDPKEEKNDDIDLNNIEL